MLYSTSDEKLVKKEIKRLQPLNYNRFFWWRRYASKTQPLPKSSTFLDRIKNSEYEFSHYYWQWRLTELEINEVYKSYNNDIQKLLESNQIDLSRRKKLMEDFEKDESSRLDTLQKGFLREFVMTREEYEEHIINFDGTTEEFYMYCLKTFDLSGKSIERRGRPPKQKR
tara:strand:+ start:2633 stop:3139 length:507 start_codon:yes stop_codon:yes gene_type:complete